MTLYKNIFWATMTLLIVAVTFSLLFDTAKPPMELSISELVSRINSGVVEKITVQGNDLAVELKDGEKGVAKKEPESGLTQTLNNYGVDPKLLSGVKLEVKDQSGFNFWMGVLVPTLLPLIVIGFMFWFIFRQAKGGANQAFSFGKSNLKCSDFSRSA